ncbi:MAG: extracellular solute-binding protein [Clostridia bacterium]|nr:extracellular solute-binding protein [Clostridia bacterium]
MKKKIVKFGAVLMALAFTLTAAFACGKNNGKKPIAPHSLKITFYDGGYGRAWAYKLAEKFTQETGIVIDQETGINPSKTTTDDIPNALANGTDTDIFFSHNIIWEVPASKGQIEPLDDLFAMECDGKTVADRVLPELLNDCKLKFNGSYYKLPWTNGAGGLIYNKVLFDKYGWEVPETYNELVALCETIENAKIVANPEAPKAEQVNIKPFAWSSECYYWDYLVFDWWAQLEGVDSIENLKKLPSADVFDPAKGYKFPEAVQLWADLVAPHEVNGVLRDYSMKDSSGRHYQAAQIDFLNGFAAMMPNAQWLESEMRDNIDYEKCEMVLMPAPVVPGAKTDGEGNPIRVNYQVGGGDSIIIPACSVNKEEAKQFLRFMMREENAKLFTERTQGVMLGVKYDNLDGIGDRYLTKFARSVFEVNTNSRKFNLYSQANMVLNNKITLEWADTGVNHYAELYNKATTVDAVFATRLSDIKANFAQWKSDSDKVFGAE